MARNIMVLLLFSLFTSGCGTFLPGPLAPVEPELRPQLGSTRESNPRAQRSEALLQTLLALGIDYRPGGRSPVSGFDCSGLVAHVYRQTYGIRLPHNARAQSEAGVPVELAEMAPGDLVFYDTLNRPYSHVGIYLGDGRFVHAPKSGARVRVESLSSTYWTQRFNGARRIEPVF